MFISIEQVNTKMKTYVYYSATNRAVELIIARSRQDADAYLMQKLEQMQVIVKNDYVLMTTLIHVEGKSTGFNF